jgi:D-3-phosphoglycerate dehydrogenase
MTKALITCLHLQRHFAKLRPQYDALGVTAILPEVAGQQLDAAGMREHIAGVDAVIAGDDGIDASVLEAGKAAGLKAVIKWGIGTDSIDKVKAAELGIPVYNTPGVFSEEVADLALSLLLNVTRQTHRMHHSVVENGWLKVEGRTLAGMTAAVIGLGSIGLAIARRMAAFGTQVIGYDVRAIDPSVLSPIPVRQVALDELFRSSDVILLACNLTAENRHLIDAGAFAAMKEGVFIVNVSRGPLIDEAALAEALASGKVGGAGLDVFEVEPLPAASPLRAFESCVFATHNGSNTREAVARINQATTDILFHVLGLKTAPGFIPNRVA